MPELPEVETVINEIAPYIIGRTITGVSLPWEGIIKEPSPSEFVRRVTGQKIESIARRGKFILAKLSTGDYLVVHLKMTGALLVGLMEPPKYTRAAIHLDNGDTVYFRDPRKFGVLKLVKNTEKIESQLGPEPLEKEFTPSVFAGRLQSHKAPIKAVLLDQKVLAGVGNMYADEALFAARIHPERLANSLKQPEIKRLYDARLQVLRAAIKSKGASVVNYMRPDSSLGTAHFQFKVAHGLHKTCPICVGPVKRIVVRGRGTYFCPKCQRK
jgi:formamidopyrimidine-DNA glycosylase